MVNLPDRSVCRVIRHYSTRVTDPMERLKFLRFCTAIAQRNRYLALRHPWRGWLYRLMFLDSLANTPQVRKQSLRYRDRCWLWLFRRRNDIRRWRVVFAACAALGLAGYWFSTLRSPDASPETARTPSRPMARSSVPPTAAAASGPEVWLVETKGSTEFYSSGLRISNGTPAHTARRFYPVFTIGSQDTFRLLEWRENAAGIVWHTTESDPAPLEKENSRRIHYQGQRLLAYVRSNKLYNFVIDRFGRVHRTVPEREYARHAGHSLWSSGGELYLNLNQSFIGVSLESGTAPRNTSPADDLTAAQLTSAKLLTEMLRQSFDIPLENMVTHEMVSVNPANVLVGYHTDFKGRFPFAALGLPDNYQIPVPSVAVWGFQYDRQFVADLGGKVWPGIRSAQQHFEQAARLQNLPVERYRARQVNLYRQLSRLGRARGPSAGTNTDSF